MSLFYFITLKKAKNKIAVTRRLNKLEKRVRNYFYHIFEQLFPILLFWLLVVKFSHIHLPIMSTTKWEFNLNF